VKFIMAHDLARRRAVAAVAEAPAGYVVTVEEPKRNTEQNALLWVWLTAFSLQLDWPVNGERVKISADEWKDILSAGYRKYHPRIALGIDGGMVMLGMRTSRMGKREFADFIDYIGAVAADRGVTLQEVAC